MNFVTIVFIGDTENHTSFVLYLTPQFELLLKKLFDSSSTII